MPLPPMLPDDGKPVAGIGPRRPSSGAGSAPRDSGRPCDRHADRFSNAAVSPCRVEELRCVSTVQFQVVAGYAGHSDAVRCRPFPEPSAQIIGMELSLLGRLSNDDRLGEAIVVRLAGCRRDLGYAVRVLAWCRCRRR